MLEINNIYNMDCLEGMDLMAKQDMKVDAVITDPPYGTTNRNKWDTIIPLDKMWNKINNIYNKDTPILLFADEPFTSSLIMSNPKLFKQRITWDKDRGSGFLNAKRMLLKQTEDICLFYEKLPTYNPQMTIADTDRIRPVSKPGGTSSNYGKHTAKSGKDYDKTKRYPTNLIKFSSMMQECNNLHRVHPTQKPVALIEYLIKTYSNENDLILDFTIGSGTTAIAAMNTNRNFIGFELDEKYYQIAKDRINKHIIDNELQHKYKILK